MRSLALLTALAVACAAGEPPAEGPPDVVADAPDDAGGLDALDVAAPDAPALDDVLGDAVAPQDAADVTTAEAAVDAPADVGMDASLPPDAGPMADGLPAGAVMYFTGAACPRDWEPFAEAAGRVALPAVSALLVGVTRGAPLASGEDRAHAHTLSGTFTLEGVNYAGIAGGTNRGVGASGEVAFTAEAAPASAGLPYVQLLVCRKAAPPGEVALPPPAGMLVFFTGDRCPPGYSRPEEPQGHLPVGLPSGGLPGARFGATPPGAVEARPHLHEAAPELTTEAHGIALASGCCASGYARSGSYRAMRSTSTAEAGPPTIALLLCQKD